MMVYDEKNKHALLFRLNPIVKIILMTLVSLFVTFDYMPYFPAFILVSCILSTVVLGEIKLKSFLGTVLPFTLMASGFLIFTLFTRGLGIDGQPDVVFLGLKWSHQDILISLSLCFRILAIAACSASFVITTNPVDFILSLMKYLHLPYRIGYAVLAAYRFLPSFREELTTIQFAHEVRGIDGRGGLGRRFAALKRYLIPMLATAVRKGERMSFAMETRAFGAHKTRTTFRELKVSREDIVFLVISASLCITIVIVFYKLKLLNISLGFSLK